MKTKKQGVTLVEMDRKDAVMKVAAAVQKISKDNSKEIFIKLAPGEWLGLWVASDWDDVPEGYAPLYFTTVDAPDHEGDECGEGGLWTEYLKQDEPMDPLETVVCALDILQTVLPKNFPAKSVTL